MKKICAWLLALLMLLGTVPALAEEADTLIVGTTTAMSGNFMNSWFGTNTADIDVQYLLHDYALTHWDASQATWIFNERVVRKMTAETVDGTRRYNLYIRKGLSYSDGTPITAMDYAFSILLAVSPQLTELGASVNAADYIMGSDAYRKGEKLSLRGLRVLDDNRIIITVDENHTPDFFELSLLSYHPYPIHIIAPGCKVLDGDVGCKIVGDFTTELLARTLLDPVNGYVTNPAAVSGPYTLESYDAANSVATFKRNPQHMFNIDGEKATIENITFKLVRNEDVITMLQSGELHLMNKATRTDVVNAGLALAAEGTLTALDYPRTGLSFISFACEQQGVDSQAVRQAIAHCVNQLTAVNAYVGGHGIPVNGLYGTGQWMVQHLSENDADAFNSLPAYVPSTAAAAELLDADGWTLNANGLREKDGVVLDLTLIFPEGNTLGDYLAGDFANALKEVGIALTVKAVPFAELLQVYYRQVERDVDMIYLASNFGVVYDPSTMVDPSEAAQGIDNRTGIRDTMLHDLAVSMRKTKPGDVETYVTRWLAFQQRWMELLPAIPVYANTYYDLCTPALTNYEPGSEQTWSQAIVGAELK